MSLFIHSSKLRLPLRSTCWGIPQSPETHLSMRPHFGFCCSSFRNVIQRMQFLQLYNGVISHIATIHSNQRRKKLSCRPMLEFTTLLYVYKLVVSDKVKYYRIMELKNPFFVRIPEKKNFFKNNQLLKSNYDFACKVIS